MEDDRNKGSYKFNSLSQVTAALREAGLVSPNLIFAIDFGKMDLHTIGDTPNPFEKVISVIGETLAPFHEDKLIPCFGLTFHDGPISFAPVIEEAINILERSEGQYHVLVIIANGQVAKSDHMNYQELSPQEEETIRSIQRARSYPLSIVLVGVGDGPWDDMTKFISKIPVGTIDNFQFILSKDASAYENDAEFAFAALKGIPFQYQAAIELGMIKCVNGRE